LIGITFFLIAGYGCVILDWLVYLRSRAREFGIRSLHGALARDLIWENFITGLPSLAIGSLVGGLCAGGLVILIGRIPLSAEEFVDLGIAIATTVSIAALVWFIVLFFVIRMQYEVDLVG